MTKSQQKQRESESLELLEYRVCSTQLGQIRNSLDYKEDTAEELELMNQMEELWKKLAPEDKKLLREENHYIRGYEDGED